MKVISDGTTHGTEVFDDAGNKIGMVKRLTLEIDVNQPLPELIITCFKPKIEYNGPGKVVYEEEKGEESAGEVHP